VKIGLDLLVKLLVTEKSRPDARKKVAWCLGPTLQAHTDIT